VRLHGDTRYGDLLLDNFGGEEWLGKTFAEKRRFLMHESVPKAVVTLHEIKRLWKQRRMSKIRPLRCCFKR